MLHLKVFILWIVTLVYCCWYNGWTEISAKTHLSSRQQELAGKCIMSWEYLLSTSVVTICQVTSRYVFKGSIGSITDDLTLKIFRNLYHNWKLLFLLADSRLDTNMEKVTLDMKQQHDEESVRGERRVPLCMLRKQNTFYNTPDGNAPDTCRCPRETQIFYIFHVWKWWLNQMATVAETNKPDYLFSSTGAVPSIILPA